MFKKKVAIAALAMGVNAVPSMSRSEVHRYLRKENCVAWVVRCICVNNCTWPMCISDFLCFGLLCQTLALQRRERERERELVGVRRSAITVTLTFLFLHTTQFLAPVVGPA